MRGLNDHYLIPRLLTDGEPLQTEWLLDLLTTEDTAPADRVFNFNTVDATVSWTKNSVLIEDILNEEGETELPLSTLCQMLANLSGPLSMLVDRVEMDFGKTPLRPESEAPIALAVLAQVPASAHNRIAAAALLAADGDLAELKNQVQLSHLDWRDVLVNGGLAHTDWRSTLQRELSAKQNRTVTGQNKSWPDRLKQQLFGR